MEALYREDLKDMGCAVKGCTHDHSILFMSPRCHPDATLIAKYKKSESTLYILCFMCEQLVEKFKIATKENK